jgi:hypothetical protein
MMLVVGAGLLVKSFSRLSNVSLGFDADRTLYLRVTIAASRYARPSEYLPVADRMLARVREVPESRPPRWPKTGPCAREASQARL